MKDESLNVTNGSPIHKEHCYNNNFKKNSEQCTSLTRVNLSFLVT